jgi:polyhydroxyalkanoate synthase subunit PhaC
VYDFIANYINDRQAFAVREQRGVMDRLLSLPRIATLARETRTGTSPHDVVLDNGAFRLLRYRRVTPATHRQPILFCYALINRPYILDLQPGKSVVQRYLERGFDVYMVDWGIPSPAERSLTLHDYVCDRLAGAVDFILRAHSIKQLNMLGYCMGGTLSTLLAALEPQLVKTLTLLAAPIDFSGKQSLLELWTNARHFDVDAFIDAYGNCPAAFLQACFLCLRPVENLLEKPIGFYERMDDVDFVASYFALESWLNDNIPVAGETFREFVKHLYQRNELVRGELHLGGRSVGLHRIECPLLLLTANGDHLVPPASTTTLGRHVSSRDVTSMTIDAGHVGLVVSSKAHRTFWPSAVQWLTERA